VLLWGTWLLTLWVFFSGGIYLHSYYVAALAPAIAALCGTGAAVAWSQRGHPASRMACTCSGEAWGCPAGSSR
jgi:4-amino-4-deoxy-L-arabinose transferase-like glycosyltransferase